MRTWVSAAAILAALVYVQPGLADTPGAVYSDFAEDGVLSCGHSRAALNGVLNDASIYQYGDPQTLVELKLAIRKQLAGGCARPDRGSGNTAEPDPGPSESAAKARSRRGNERSSRAPNDETAAGSTSDNQRDGRIVLLGVGLLLLTLGSGAWAARRAFLDRQ